MYHYVHPRARAGVCVGEIKKHIELMALRLEKGESVFVRVVTPHMQNLLNAHEAMIRIRYGECVCVCVCVCVR
jgi:phosphotransferase system HPr-like phosphotransfer protein